MRYLTTRAATPLQDRLAQRGGPIARHKRNHSERNRCSNKRCWSGRFDFVEETFNQVREGKASGGANPDPGKDGEHPSTYLEEHHITALSAEGDTDADLTDSLLHQAICTSTSPVLPHGFSAPSVVWPAGASLLFSLCLGCPIFCPSGPCRFRTFARATADIFFLGLTSVRSRV